MGRLVTYHGQVQTTGDAIKLFEACRLGVLPRVQQRLSLPERQSIKSGSVFVWDEQQAGIQRWTDGKSWDTGRDEGSCFTYREMKRKRKRKRRGGQFPRPPARGVENTSNSAQGSDGDQEIGSDGLDGYSHKPDRLMKRLYSATTSAGNHFHLVSYYSQAHLDSSELLRPTMDPKLRHVVPVIEMYLKSAICESPGPDATRKAMQPSPYMQPSLNQLQIYGSPGRGQRGCTLPQSLVATPLPPHQPLYQPQPGSHGTSPSQNHDQPPHQRPLTLVGHESLRQMPRDLASPPFSGPSFPLPLPPHYSGWSDSRYPSTSFPPVHGMQRASTHPQRHASYQPSVPQSLSQPASSNNAFEIKRPASQAQSAISISNLVHATDSDAVMSGNERNSNGGRSKSPRESSLQRVFCLRS